MRVVEVAKNRWGIEIDGEMAGEVYPSKGQAIKHLKRLAPMSKAKRARLWAQKRKTHEEYLKGLAATMEIVRGDAKKKSMEGTAKGA